MKSVIQFRRGVPVDDGVAEVADFQNFGDPIRGKKSDVGDGERWRGSQVSDHVTTRFIVQATTFAKSITPADQLVCELVDYEITGIKEVPECNGRQLEINTVTLPKE